MLFLLGFITFVNSWTPIGSCYHLNKITNVKIADKEYVVWKTQNEQFIVQDNICPHRLAPLSEGRIENDTLECAYHGWQFNKNGTCVKIPQSSKNFSCELPTYPTRTTGDILWADLNSSDISSNLLWNNIQNDNILLDDGASINAKPQLEIFADDVRCSHGCTIGQIDESALFYMQQRGIPKKEAKALLLFAFGNDVVEKIKIPQLKNRISKLIAKNLNVDLELGM